MADFFTWFDATKKAAINTPVGKQLTEAFFMISHTGGGCLAWETTNPGNFYAWITDGEAGLGTDVADPENAQWCVGVYNNDGEEIGPCETFTSLTAAIGRANERLRAAPLRADAEAIAEAFQDLYKAASIINEVLGRNDALNESVPANWPLGLSADEWALECLAMRDHYRDLAKDRNTAISKVDKYEQAARALGWEHGGDCGGFIYNTNHYGSWKAAASWAPEHGPVYDTWQECCEKEGIAVK